VNQYLKCRNKTLKDPKEKESQATPGEGIKYIPRDQGDECKWSEPTAAQKRRENHFKLPCWP